MFFDKVRIDRDVGAGLIRCREAEVFEDAFDHCVKPTRADVFDGLVYVCSDFR